MAIKRAFLFLIAKRCSDEDDSLRAARYVDFLPEATEYRWLRELTVLFCTAGSAAWLALFLAEWRVLLGAGVSHLAKHCRVATTC